MSQVRKISLIFRVYVEQALLVEECTRATMAELDILLPQLAERHALLTKGRPAMFEIEFLDEPNANERFFRIGSDPSMMRRPMRIATKKAEA